MEPKSADSEKYPTTKVLPELSVTTHILNLSMSRQPCLPIRILGAERILRCLKRQSRQNYKRQNDSFKNVMPAHMWLLSLLIYVTG